MPIPFYRLVEYVGDGVSSYQCLNCYNYNCGYSPNWKYCPFCGIEIKGLKECRPHDEPKHHFVQSKLSENVIVIYKTYPSFFSDERQHTEIMSVVGMNLGFSVYVKQLIDYYKKEIQEDALSEEDDSMRKNILATTFFFRKMKRREINHYVVDYWRLKDERSAV